MTVTHVETNYLENPYLEGEYLSVDVLGYMGQQAQFVINDDLPLGMQCRIIIADFQRELGQQANFVIADDTPLGQQANFTVLDDTPLGQQARFSFEGAPTELGQQAEFSIATGQGPYGMQYTQTNFNHLQCLGYLEQDYLAFEHLAANICAHGAMQARFDVYDEKTLGQQAHFNIVDYRTALGQQAHFRIDALRTLGQQSLFSLSKQPALGQQAQFHIEGKLRTFGQQAQFVILDDLAFGMQAEFINVTALGMQATVSLYNTTHLRILCEFPSRGLSTAVGLNAWGNAAGQGLSWKSNSTATCDFSPQNLNTDIVEQVWRSTVDTGVNLDCDTERAQGVFLDTLAILNHNLTSSATVNLIGSNSSTFATLGVVIPLEVRADDPNVYYVAQALPTAGYRYWRVSIDDASNPDGYLEIGTIVFGAASIFVGEAFVDQVEFQLKDYTDSVQTEGFTNVSNSRAQKKILRLDFRSLSYLRANFRIMRNMFRNERTVLKCLWLPTPDPVNQEYTARFALFAKLAQIPSETHNHKGGTADYVSFTIELDESK